MKLMKLKLQVHSLARGTSKVLEGPSNALEMP
jgi:hypothetical protein